MELIEWIFTVLSFIAFYFFISKKASQASFRIIGLLLSIVINILISIFTFSIGVFSLWFVNLIYVFLNGFGILNCYIEIKSKKAKI
ncbi:MAG: hypothetical protein EU544_04280 [Promethearchaeota archaeon]|nr:MAG: hypothetical protein EU544_04280 [Candidatus Lokiarchaeota archaeon]